MGCYRFPLIDQSAEFQTKGLDVLFQRRLDLEDPRPREKRTVQAAPLLVQREVDFRESGVRRSEAQVKGFELGVRARLAVDCFVLGDVCEMKFVGADPESSGCWI